MDNNPKSNPDDGPLIETEELDPGESAVLDLIAHGADPGSAHVHRVTNKTEIQRQLMQVLDEIPGKESLYRKNAKLSMGPMMEFIEQHLDLFEDGVLKLARRGGPDSNRVFTSGLDFRGFEKAEDNVNPDENPNCQIPLIRLKQIIFSLPPELFSISSLNTVQWSDQVPDTEDDGNKLPHSRIILPSVPSAISTNQRVILNYLIYVFLREFMHSILDPLIENNMAGRVILDTVKDNDNLRLHLSRGEAKTIGQWLAELRYTVISGKEPVLTSLHSELYEEKLHHADPKEYLPALKELVCETFAAYLLNIMPNKYGYLSFESADFGNRTLKNDTFSKSGCSTDRLRLIKELCESKIFVT